MDNLTHSLIGAVLGQAGLKQKTGLAMPTLIVAANIPDIDATCTFLGTVSLAMRRGVTHGPIAMLVLPLLLTGIMIGFDRWQARRGKRPEGRLPVRPGWLLVLAYIGCLSHPLFDWMNSYGIRLLEPFSSRWFYGDALFIVDPWLLAMLVAGVWLAQGWSSSRPALTAIVGIAAYVGFNVWLSSWLESSARRWPNVEMAVANPVPLAFWQREILWRGNGLYGSYRASLVDSGSIGSPRLLGMDDPRITRRVAGNLEAQAFLFWSRMPVAEVDGETILLKDQRFHGRGIGPFVVELKPQT